MASVTLNIATDMEKENFFSPNGYSSGELLQLSPNPDGLEDFIYNDETGYYEYSEYYLAIETGKIVIKKSGFDQDPTTLAQEHHIFEQRYFYLSRTVKEDQSADAKTLQHIDFKQSRRAMVNINGGDDYTGFSSLGRFEDNNDIRHFAYYLKGDDAIYGSNEGDKIYAFSGDDSIYLRGGNSFIHGGTGYDTAHLPGKREDYIVREISDSITELRSFSDIFTFETVESLIFEDDEHVYVAELEKLPPILENNWHRMMSSGTWFEDIFTDEHENTFIAGRSNVNRDGYIAKFDAAGNREWDANLGFGQNAYIRAAEINDNSFLVASNGGTSGTYYLRSYDLNGNISWTKELNNAPTAIEALANDTFLLAYSSAPKNYDSNNTHDVFFECYSESGDLVWETTYSSTPIIDHTGRLSTSYDAVGDILALEDNTIYAIGTTTGGTDEDNPRENAARKSFIQKITSTGDIAWTKELDIPYTSWTADTISLFKAGDSLYASYPIPSEQREEIAPFDWFNINTRYSSNYPDYALTKINTSGEVQWTKGFQNSFNSGKPALIEQNNGNLLLTWNSREVKTFSDTHIPVLSEEDSDNISLASLDADGNLLWGTTLGSREDDRFIGASLNDNNLTLSFASSGQFDDSINSYGGYNYYISNYKLNPFYAVPPASYELTTSSNQLLADYPYSTTLSTTRVPEGTELFWRIEGNWPDYSKPNFESGLEGSGFINDAGELTIKHIYTASKYAEDLAASIHIYADQNYSNELITSDPLTLSYFDYSLSVDSEKSDNQVIKEGDVFRLKGSLPEATSAEAIYWKLILDETDADDWATPSLEGQSLLKSDGSFEIILETTADQKTEGWAEDFQIQLFADDQQNHALGKAQDFRLIDNSHEDFKGYPNSVHALKLLSDTYKNDLTKWDSDVGNGFYDEIWDRFSGLVPRIDLPIGNNKKELFWHIYSVPGDNNPGADIMHARGGSGEDHFLGCVDRTLEELHQGQAGIGPIRGDSHDGYLDIQDFDPTEDLLILPFNSDQPIHFDGSFLSVTTPSGATDKIFRLADGGFALSDLRNAIAYLDTINNGTIPTYSLTTSSTNLNEGHQLTTALTTTNLPAGTTLHWAIHGSVDADDFSLGDLSGSITTGDSNSNPLSHALDLDQFTEGDEQFSLTFYADAQHQRVLAETPLISITDSSRDPAQSLFSSAEQVHFFPGSTLSIPIHYSNNTGKSELSELIANIHFDSSVLTPTSSTDKPGVSWMLGADDNLGPSVRVIPETSANADGNPTTDSILELNWKHHRAEAHSTAAQAHVATLSFQTNQDPITGAPAASSLNFTANQTANGYEFLTTQTALISEPFNLDIDGDNQASLYTDGIMIIRRLIGLDQCTSGFGSEFFNKNGRHSAARVEERLGEAFNNGFFDFNQDGKTSLYSDGILLIRYMISPQLLQSSGELIGQNSPFNNNPEQLMAAFHALEPSVS